MSWKDAPVVEERNKPRWAEAEVVSEGGPSLLDKAGQFAAGGVPGMINNVTSHLIAKPEAGETVVNEMANSVSLGNADGMVAAQTLNGGSPLQAYVTDKVRGHFDGDYKQQKEAIEDAFGKHRTQLREENPVSGIAGDALGFFVPGTGAWIGGAKATAKISKKALETIVRKTTADAATSGSKLNRTARMATRAAPQMIGTAAQIAGYNATVGASNKQAATGQDVGLGERAQGVARDMTNPINYALGAAPMAANRLAIGLKTRGARVTPEAIQSQVGVNSGTSNLVLDMTRQQPGVGTSGVKLFDTILNRAGLSGEDVSGITAAVNQRVHSLNASGERVSATPMMFVQEMERRGYNQAADNVRKVVSHMSASDEFGQAINRGIDDMKGSQQQYLQGIFDDVLGPESVAQVRAAQNDAAKLAMQQREEMITNIPKDARNRNFGQYTKQMVESWQTDRPARSAMEQAARRMGYSNKDGSGAINKAVEADAPAFMNNLQSILRTSQDQSLQGLRDQAQHLLGNATRYAGAKQTPGGGFAFQPKDGSAVTPYKQKNIEYAKIKNAQEVADEANSLLTIAKDPRRSGELLEAYKGADAETQKAFSANIKSELERAFFSGKSKNIEPWMTRLENRGLHLFLEDAFGQQGQRLSRAMQQVIDEQQYIKAVDARTWGNKVAKADDKSARALYTANPVARLADKYSWMQGAVTDASSSIILPGAFPYATATKAVGTMLRPRKSSVRQLAEVMGSRPTQTITRSSQPANSFATSPAAPAIAAQPDRGAYPARLAPVMQQKQQAAQQARLRATQAAERAEVARAQMAVQDDIVKAESLAASAEAEAAALEAQAKATARVTTQTIQSAVKRATRGSRQLAKDQSKLVEARAKAQAASVEDKVATQRAAIQVKTGMSEAEAIRLRGEAAKNLKRGDKVSKGLKEQQSGDTAKDMFKAGVSPREIHQTTGHIILDFGPGNRKLIVRDIDNYDDFVRSLQDDLNNKAIKDWSPQTRKLINPDFDEGAYRWAYEGKADGLLTPGNREWTKQQAARQAKFGRRLKQTAVGAGSLWAGAATYGQVDKRRKAALSKKFQALESDREVTKLVQQALKNAGFYKGRSDGRFDDEVGQSLFRYQQSNRLPTPGEMNRKTMKRLEQQLRDAGKEDKAKALAAATP